MVQTINSYTKMKKKILIIITCTTFFLPFLWKGAEVGAQTWKPLHPLLYSLSGPTDNITALKVYNGKLLIFGNIGKIGNILLNGINRPLTWDGNIYDSIPGLCNFNGMVYSFAEFGNNLYCGGYFYDPTTGSGVGNIPNTKNIARFNGTTMEALNTVTPSAQVQVLKTKDNMLYIAGSFYFIGNTTYGPAAGYNGTNYFHLGAGVQGMNPNVSAMTVYNNEIIICGAFDWVGNQYIPNGIAAWNGTTWHKLKDVDFYATQSMVVDTINNFLYVVGVQNNDTSYVLKRWNGYYWEDTGLLSYLFSTKLCMYHKELYSGISARLVSPAVLGVDSITGNMIIISPAVWATDTILMRYDGNNWFNIPKLNSDISDMCVYNDDLYIAGYFTMAGTDSAYGIACLHVDTPAGCNWLMPRTFTNADTVYLNGGHAPVQFYNNNAYAQSWLWIFGDGTTATVKDTLHSYNASGIYTATITVTEDGCTKTAQKTITVLNGSGLEEYSKDKLGFKLYPNPTTGDITVELTLKDDAPAEIRAYSNYGSLQGQYSLQKGYNKLELPASKWDSGLSLVSLYIDGKQVLVEKVVKSGH
jgi:hypothetical protein